ncbi:MULTISPECIES: MFS transporter [Kyrpidia]|uniref:Tartrate transporter n=2 Tax=Kyrpidia spormannii TaxID=2055160 RepID=A0ACA8ZCP7_9BACL|nr:MULTISPECIES: MFS transporter [Kyrpidia]MCL6575799.1 MFS transporter [Kyrpidia sp.]CAB3394410.1 putative tartrate transporter [Kyrpidia spormannii]CAB3395353.1 putative tartrate transporter [Kyrpidia spormannii]
MSSSATLSIEQRTSNKVRIRILPFMFVLYIISFLDRVNLGYAALDMNKALAITSEQFGLIAGIFFFGYFIFEIPSNVLMHRIGARIWIARILLSWGSVAMLTAVAQNAVHLYILRFLLGVAEAGFFPGMILYLTYWFRGRELAHVVALFMTAVAVSNIIGAPVSGVILDYVDWFGLPGWRWLFILEGAPAVIFGILTFFVLPNRPRDAAWLTEEEKSWLQGELDREAAQKLHQEKMSLGRVFASGRVWLLALIYFADVVGLYGIGFWMPQIIKGLSQYLSNTAVGLLAMIPYLVGVVAMVWSGRDSDRKGERRWHVAVPLLIAGAGMAVLGPVSNPFWAIVLLSITTAAIYSVVGPFWALPNLFLAESTAAVGIAIINSVGNLGGFVGPYIIGALKASTGSVASGLYFLAACLLAGMILVLLLPLRRSVSSRSE